MPRRTNAPQKFKRSLSQNQEPILSKNCMNECLFSASLIHHESKTSGGSIVWSLNFSDVIWKSPTEKFPSLVWQYPIIQFTLYYVTSDCLREAKTKREFQTFNPDLMVVAVIYERCSLTRASKYSDLKTFGILENWSLRRGGPLLNF